MNIYTITCHDVYNAGASLQAYALISYLVHQGHNARIINYKPPYLSNHYALWGRITPRYDKPILRLLYQLIKFPGRFINRIGKRKRAFDNFRKSFLRLTEKRYNSIKELRQSPPDADVYFAGSDQIWNTLFPNGKDPAFYLDFLPNSKVKASYAASFATDYIEKKYHSEIKTRLNKLDFISVRECSGLQILEELGIQRGTQVMDPVFLLSCEQWQAMESNFYTKNHYILVCDFDGNEELKRYAQKISNDNGWKIYSYLPCDYADCSFSNNGPQTFLSLIHHAELIISNSFHATAFSLIYEKNFVVFSRNENLNTRMSDLLNLIESPARQYPRDYTTIRPRIQRAIEKSKFFIDTVLNSAKQNNV